VTCAAGVLLAPWLVRAEAAASMISGLGQVRRELVDSGWSLAARGDWAWVYRSPDGARAARVCPYDPAHRLFLRYCQRHAGERFLPPVFEVRELLGGGHLAVMPWLDEVSEPEADELAARLGYPRKAHARLGAARVHELEAEGARDPALRDVRRILDELVAEGQRSLPFFGGTDLQAQNVRKTADGQLQLIDPIFVAGREIIAALRRDAMAVAQRISIADLHAFLKLPCFEGSEGDPAFGELVEIVVGLDDAWPERQSSTA
jgi:hypothetical protein